MNGVYSDVDAAVLLGMPAIQNTCLAGHPIGIWSIAPSARGVNI